MAHERRGGNLPPIHSRTGRAALQGIGAHGSVRVIGAQARGDCGRAGARQRAPPPHAFDGDFGRAFFGMESSRLSAGFRMWNEHISVSSTDIIAPALSNSPQ